MTLILAAKDKKGKVFIGADSRGSDSYTYHDGTNKLIPQHNYVVGCSGSFRTLDLIRYNQDRFFPVTCDADMFRWVGELRSLLTENGFKSESAGRGDPGHDGVLLILAAPHTPYYVEYNYQFHPMSRTAVGCGYLYGQGYFDALPDTMPMKERIETSIVRTSDIMVGVSPDAQVMEVGDTEELT